MSARDVSSARVATGGRTSITPTNQNGRVCDMCGAHGSTTSHYRNLKPSSRATTSCGSGLAFRVAASIITMVASAVPAHSPS